MLQGAILSAKVNLKVDEVLHVAIGQQGAALSDCGSGGTFVIRECSNGSLQPIVIAGGAGGDHGGIPENLIMEDGSAHGRFSKRCDAQLNEFGNGSNFGETSNNIGGSGISGCPNFYNGGAGYKTSAPNSTENYPKSFQDGLQGGNFDG